MFLTVSTCHMLIIFVGEKLVNFLVEPKKGTKWPKILPRFNDRTQAIAVCKELCNLQYILRCEKLGKGELGVSVVFVALLWNHFLLISFLFVDDA